MDGLNGLVCAFAAARISIDTTSVLLLLLLLLLPVVVVVGAEADEVAMGAC